ncbi:protein kinase [Thermodesulfobacteriota bacterium]
MNQKEDNDRKSSVKLKGAQKIGRYEILGTLGRGNMGQVFRARDPMIGRLVALKTRRFDLVYDEEDLELVINKFFEEARIAGNLVHPNIVTIHDVGRDGEHCYIAMELLEGEPLTAHNREETLLEPEAVCSLIKKVLIALDFAHSRNVIHRDIKPANLMLTRNKMIKITDFGIATMARADEATGFEVMGTPSYMSPEQTTGTQLTKHTDFFSVGVVLYELLCGRRPFQGRTLYELMDNIRYAPPPSILDVNPALPPGIDLVLQKVLEKEPELRYQSGAEFAGEIARAMKGERITLDDIKASRKAEILKSVDFFRPFSRKEIADIVRFGKFRRYDKNLVILKEGDVDTTLFVLLHGRARVIRNKKKIADLPVGACFGEMGAFTKMPRTAHVIAKDACLVLKLDLKLVDRETDQLRLKFYRTVMKTLIERLEETTRRLIDARGDRDAKKR